MRHPDLDAAVVRVQRARYRPAALVGFLMDSGALTCRTAARQPALVDSWRGRALLRVLALPLGARLLGCPPWSPALWLTYLWQLTDLYIHLGLNRHSDILVPYPRFTLATECTILRAYAAAALAGGCTRPRRALVCGVLTDVLDGPLARRTRGVTLLGALLDSEYDAYLALAALRAAARQAGRDRDLERSVALRFGGQGLIALVCFFGRRPALGANSARASLSPVGSTWAGRVSGAVQALALYHALSRPGAGTTARHHPLSRAALLASALGAVVAQAARYRTP